MNLVLKIWIAMPKENVIANAMYVVTNVMNAVLGIMDLPFMTQITQKKGHFWIIAMVTLSKKYLALQK